MNKLKWHLIGLVILILGIALACIFSYRGGYKKCDAYYKSLPVQRDTVTVLDTHFVDRPKPVYSHSIDTLYIPVPVPVDSQPGDSIQVPLVRESRMFHKDSVYTAWVSGYQPSLDSIKVFNKTDYITNTTYLPEYKRFQNSVYLSAEGVYAKTFYVPITINYERMWKFGSIYAGAGYEPLQKAPVIKVGAKLKFDF